MKKILFILHIPPPIHGAAVVGGYIKNSLSIGTEFESRFVNLSISDSISEIGKSPFKKVINYLSLLWKVKTQLFIFKPDICYLTPTAHGIGFYKDALIIVLSKLFSVTTVFHYHNKGVKERENKIIDNILYKSVFRKSKVILLSRHLYYDIQKYVPVSRVYYCPNGIPELLKRELRSENGKHPDTFPVILFLSHLIRSKGILVLIDACQLLKTRGIRFSCIIAGGNAELEPEEIESIIVQKNLNGSVSLTGPKLGDEKLKLFGSVDIFVHPTYNDCLPLVLLEAMQFSLPVVSTFEGAIPDLVDDTVTGFLVPQKDPKILADKLEILIKDAELRQKMGAAGRAKYEREFTLEKFERRMVEILMTVSDGGEQM